MNHSTKGKLSATRKPLEVGDRVRAYEANGNLVGEIVSESSDDTVEVCGKIEGIKKARKETWSVHVKQCRRLKPKKPKAIPERRFELVELPEGSVVVSREELARAYEKAWNDSDGEMLREEVISAVCASLGIKGEK